MHNNRSRKCLAPITKHARSKKWEPVTVIEMKKFLVLIFVTGIVRKPKLELYWSTRRIFQTPVFQQTMSRNRFQLIQRYLHYNDNNAVGTNEDRFYPHHTSRKARVEHLYLLQQNVPQKMTPHGRLDGKLKTHKLVPYSTHKK